MNIFSSFRMPGFSDGISSTFSFKALPALNSLTSLLNYGVQHQMSKSASALEEKRMMAQSNWANLQANQIRINAENSVNDIRDQLLSDMASTTAAFAGRGVDVGSGTAAYANVVNRRRAANDILNVRNQAAISEMAGRRNAQTMANESRLARAQGQYERSKIKSNAMSAGFNLLYGLKGILS